MKKFLVLLTATAICLSALITGGLAVSAGGTEFGYCAVGETDASRAAILLGDGTVKTVDFTGTAPVSGTVNAYSAQDGVYTFTAITFPGYSGWRIYDNTDANGDYFNDGGSTNAFFADSVAGFLKFSDTSWRVFSGKHMIKIADGVGDYPHTAWPCNIEANWNNELMAMDVIFADCTKQYTSGPEPSKLFDETGNGFTEGDKNVVLEGAPDHGTETPEVITKSLCAVGEVDTEKSLAAVMLEDGVVRTVKFTGTAPVSGKVHTYSVSDGVYTFAEYSYYADGAQWRVYDGLIEGSEDKSDFFVAYDAAGVETRMYCTGNCLTFIKFSDTNWAFFNKGNIINIRTRLDPDWDYTAWPSNLMFTWNTEELVSLVSQIDSVFCDATQSKDGTRYYTQDESPMTKGDKNLVIVYDDTGDTGDPGDNPGTGDMISAAVVITALACAAFVFDRNRRL